MHTLLSEEKLQQILILEKFNDDFSDELFIDNFFPDGSTAANDANNNDTRDLIKGISFRNNAIFTDCILMINNVLINNGEDLDVVMPIFNLLGYSKNYEKITESL